MLFSDSLNAVKDGEKGFLERLCVSTRFSNSDSDELRAAEGSPPEFFSRFPPHSLDVLTRSPRAHRPNVVRAKLGLDWPNGRAVARDDQGAAAGPARELWTPRHRSVNMLLTIFVLGRPRGRIRPLYRRRVGGRAVLRIVLLLHGGLGSDEGVVKGLLSRRCRFEGVVR